MAADTFRKINKTLTQEDILAMNAVKDAGAAFEAALEAYVHPGREKALALTKIEEAVMWAVKGVTQ